MESKIILFIALTIGVFNLAYITRSGKATPITTSINLFAFVLGLGCMLSGR